MEQKHKELNNFLSTKYNERSKQQFKEFVKIATSDGHGSLSQAQINEMMLNRGFNK